MYVLPGIDYLLNMERKQYQRLFPFKIYFPSESKRETRQIWRDGM